MPTQEFQVKFTGDGKKLHNTLKEIDGATKKTIKGMERSIGDVLSPLFGKLGGGFIGDALGGLGGGMLERAGGIKSLFTVRNMATAIGAAVAAKVGYDVMQFKQNERQASLAGVTTGEYKRYGAAFKSSGLEANDFLTAINQIATSRTAALNGDERQLKAFAGLGMSKSDLESMRPVEVFIKAIGELSSRSGNIQSTANGFVIMGDNFTLLNDKLGSLNKNLQTATNLVGTTELYEEAVKRASGIIDTAVKILTVAGASLLALIQLVALGLSNAATTLASIVLPKNSPMGIMAQAVAESTAEEMDTLNDMMSGRYKKEDSQEQKNKRVEQKARDIANQTPVKTQEKALEYKWNEVFKTNVDKLAQIGLYRGPQSVLNNINQKQLIALDKCVYELQRMNKTLTTP